MKSASKKEDLLAVIEDEIEIYIHQQEVYSDWRSPLLAAASADDKLFSQLQEAVSPEHMMPEDLLEGARTVLCYFLPFAPRIPASSAAGPRPSQAWAAAYRETNELIGRINRRLQSEIAGRGGRADFAAATGNFSREELVSYWSHKHAGYIAGLGTFGRHSMLITPSGCAGRIGSIVTDIEFKSDKRPGQEYCLDRAGQDCRSCVNSCDFSALSSQGLDRESCYQTCLDNADYFGSESLEICGKCAVDVPCTLHNPVD